MNNTVQELIERVVELNRSYAIWWELVNVENRSTYEMQILDHEDFFAATAHAHFQSIVVVLYQLFDKRRGTKSIHNLLVEMKAADPELVRTLNEQIQPHLPMLKRVFDVRGNVYAHRNASLSPEEVFARAKISPDVLGSLVSLAQDVVAAFGEAAGIGSRDGLMGEFKLRGDMARDDIKNVLRLLEHLRSNLSIQRTLASERR